MMPIDDADAGPLRVQQRLVESLRNPARWPSAAAVTIIETHISYVLLTGTHAYKIKKAVNLGFVDFTTLAARRFSCEEELRLNRRLAPSVYLQVVAIAGTADAPIVGGAGPPIEYAVQMREFPQDALLSRMLAANRLSPERVDAIADRVAAFHAAIASARPPGAFGSPAETLRLALENFTQIRPSVDPADRATLDGLSEWTRRECTRRSTVFERRYRDGFVRECHGDLHVGNIALVDGELAIFDCIEFSEAMRWTDVMSDVAFLVMDLEDRGRPDLGARFLNAYLERTGDYAGVPVLRFHLAYRAMVRAKVAWMRAAQLTASDTRQAPLVEYRGYIELATRYAHRAHAAVVLMHGLAGSGKTTASQRLIEAIDAIRVRTDIERKRVHGLGAAARTASPVGGGLYTADMTEGTYRRVASLVRDIVAGGYVAVVDGAFLKRWQRTWFRELARELAVPFAIVDCRATMATLRRRVAERVRKAEDASEADQAVLDFQQANEEPLGADEQADPIACDTDEPLDAKRASSLATAVCARIGIAAGGSDIDV